MQKADIVIVSGVGLVSETIEGVTHSKYSHVALAIDDKHVVEAAANGVVVRNMLSEYGNLPYIIMRPLVPISEQLAENIAETALGYTGTPYNWFETLWAGLMRVSGLGWRNPFFSKRAMDCVNLVVNSYHDNNCTLFTSNDPGSIAPSDFADNALLYINEGHFPGGISG